MHTCMPGALPMIMLTISSMHSSLGVELVDSNGSGDTQCDAGFYYSPSDDECRPCYRGCSDAGCAGPSNSDCLNDGVNYGCRYYHSESGCVDTCDWIHQYASNGSCLRCSTLCASDLRRGEHGCTGPETSDCTRCRGISLRGICVSDSSCSYDLWYDNATQECGDCHPECSRNITDDVHRCTGPDDTQCFSCLNVNRSGHCVPACFPNQYENDNGSCQNCNSLCDESEGCYGPSSSDCEKCSGYRLMNGTCTSMCPNTTHYGHVGIDDSESVCTECSPTCNNNSLLGPVACFGPTPSECNLCAGYLNGTNCVEACTSTQYALEIPGANSIYGTCLPCHEQCSEDGCTGPLSSQCNECSSASLHINGRTTCVSECPEGMYLDEAEDKLCTPCSNECLYGCTAAGSDACTTAVSGSGNPLLSDATTLGCRSFALVTSPITITCVALCPTGYVSDTNRICQQCHPQCFDVDDAYCLGTQADQCRCQSNRYFNNTTRNCLACNSNCGEFGCHGPTSFDCISCPSALLDGACVEKCPIERYEAPSGHCYPCHESCGHFGCTGPGSNQCNQCSDPRTEFFDHITRNCSFCDDACSDNGCRGPLVSDCIDCNGVIIDGECLPSCPMGSYPLETQETSETTCQVCHPSCRDDGCFGPGPDGCVVCQTGSRDILSGRCTATCPLGTYIVERDMLEEDSTWQILPLWEDPAFCHPCQDECWTCTNTSYCIECADVRGRNGSCLLECSQFENIGPNRNCECAPNTYLDSRSDACTPCNTECASGCIGPTDVDCIDVPSGCRHYAKDGRCLGVCDFGEVGNPTTRECECAPGYFRNSTGGCEQCHELCRSGCTGSGPERCMSNGIIDCEGVRKNTTCVYNCLANEVAVNVSVPGIAEPQLECQSCSPMCRQSCRSPSDATSCAGTRKCKYFLYGTSPQAPCVPSCDLGFTYRAHPDGDFICTSKCPASKPYYYDVTPDIVECATNCALLGSDLVLEMSTSFYCKNLVDLAVIDRKAGDDDSSFYFIAVPLLLLILGLISYKVGKAIYKRGGANIAGVAKTENLAFLPPTATLQIRGTAFSRDCTIDPASFSQSHFDAIPLNAVPQELETPEQRLLNRYRNVLPNPKSRVKLPKSKDFKGSDYINANHIHGYGNISKAYIAAQAPKDNGLTQFWRMIWHEDVRVIVMLTRLVEKGQSKSARYWPEHPGENLTIGDFVISHDRNEDNGSFLSTSLRVTFRKQTKQVKHLWYKDWPDLGVPDADTAASSLVRLANTAQKISMPTSTPILVHCSAGIGRTGSFIALDYGLDSLYYDKRFNIVEIIKTLRDGRGGMVQTYEQAAFVISILKHHLGLPTSDTMSSDNPAASSRQYMPTALSGPSHLTLTDQSSTPVNRVNANSTVSTSFSASRIKIHNVGILSPDDATVWATRVLAPYDQRTSLSGMQQPWRPTPDDNGRFVVRALPDDDNYVLSIIYKQQITLHPVSLGGPGENTSVGRYEFAHCNTIEDLILQLSSDNLPQNLVGTKQWPIRLKFDGSLSTREIVHACIEHLETNTILSLEGIFRVNADETEVKSLCEAISIDPIRAVSTLSQYDPHTVSAFLKKYIRDLDDPIVGPSMYGAWLGAAKLPKQAQIPMLQKLVKRLTDENRSILIRLLPFLKRVGSDEFDSNRMDIGSLSIIWGPSLIPAPKIETHVDPSLELSRSDQITTIASVFINNYDEIFQLSQSRGPVVDNASKSVTDHPSLSEDHSNDAVESDQNTSRTPPINSDSKNTNAALKPLDLKNEKNWLHPVTKGKEAAFIYMREHAPNANTNDGVFMIENHETPGNFVLNVFYRQKPRRFLIVQSENGLLINNKVYTSNGQPITSLVEFLAAVIDPESSLPDNWPVRMTYCIPPPSDVAATFLVSNTTGVNQDSEPIDIDRISTWLHPQIRGKDSTFQYMADNASDDDGVFMIQKHPNDNNYVLNVVYKGKPRRFLVTVGEGPLRINNKAYINADGFEFQSFEEFLRVVTDESQPLPPRWPVRLTTIIPPPSDSSDSNNNLSACNEIAVNPNDQQYLKVGQRVIYQNQLVQSPGTIRFVGMHHKKKMMRYGIELDNPVGLNNGTIGGHQYFSCPESCGVLSVIDNVKPLNNKPEVEDISTSNTEVSRIDLITANINPATERIEFVLTKSADGFGIKFGGAKNTSIGSDKGFGIIIKETSGAAKRHNIPLGWQVVTVNGSDIRDATFRDLKHALILEDSSVTFVIEKNERLADAYGVSIESPARIGEVTTQSNITTRTTTVDNVNPTAAETSELSEMNKPALTGERERLESVANEDSIDPSVNAVAESGDIFSAISSPVPVLPNLPERQGSIRTSSLPESDAAFEIEIHKVPDRKMGLYLRDTTDGIRIVKVDPAGLVYETGVNVVGARIIAINGKNTVDATKTDALSIIKAHDMVVLTLLPHGTPLPANYEIDISAKSIRSLNAKECIKLLRDAGITDYKSARTVEDLRMMVETMQQRSLASTRL